VVVKERRARAVGRAAVGAAAKRVRVGAGRRRREAKSLEAIVAVWWEGCWVGWRKCVLRVGSGVLEVEV
jgi:hypothetical protein